MPQFLLLLHHPNPERFKKLPPDELQAAIAKYMAWTQKPFNVSSNRLDPDGGRVVRQNGGSPVVTDGPFGETKEVCGGYFLIEAADYDDAVRLTLDHPHLQHGGTIEVRKIWQP